VPRGTSDLVFFFLKIIFLSFHFFKVFICSQQFISPTYKKPCINTLYFRLHKNDKRLNLSMYVSNLQILSDFVIFV
jgi:hypothetical protein